MDWKECPGGRNEEEGNKMDSDDLFSHTNSIAYIQTQKSQHSVYRP
jgi:hypothetical protein